MGQIEVDQGDMARRHGQLVEQAAGRGLAVHDAKARPGIQEGAHAQRNHGVVVQDCHAYQGGRLRHQEMLARMGAIALFLAARPVGRKEGGILR